MGMWAVPIYVGKIFTKTITEAGNKTQEISAAIKAEYVFILLGVVAIGVAIMLLRSSRKYPELKLDEPAS
jgi:dipeptide/tripeptide permease